MIHLDSRFVESSILTFLITQGKWMSEVLKLQDLHNGLPGVTPSICTAFSEAAAFCLEKNGHISGVKLVRATPPNSKSIEWSFEVTDQIRRSYNDLQYATEDGAYALAFLTILKETDYTVIMQSRKGTGFDYWLGKKGGVLFQNSARLEVSGIYKGTESEINSRLKQKLNQTKRSDNTVPLPAYAVIVEFSKPKIMIESRA